MGSRIRSSTQRPAQICLRVFAPRPAGCNARLTRSARCAVWRAVGLTLRIGIASLVSLLFALRLAGTAAADTCDPDIIVPRDDPNAYRWRDDRCEGVFAIPLRGEPALTVVSLTASATAMSAEKPTSLVLMWRPLKEPLVKIQVVSLNPHTHYRMDTVTHGASGAFQWPADIPNALELPLRELGVTAFATLPVHGSTKTFLVPMVLATDTERPPERNSLWLVVVPSVDLSVLRYQVAPYRADGMVGSFLTPPIAVQERPILADHPVSIEIAVPAAGNLAWLHLALTSEVPEYVHGIPPARRLLVVRQDTTR